MKFLVRWTLRLLVILVVLAVALVLLKDIMLKELTQSRLRVATGLGVEIEQVNLALFSPTLTIRGLRLFNPPEFGASTFIDVPEMHFEYDRRALAKRELHLLLVRLSLAEVNIVEDGTGKSNLEAIQSLLKRRPPPESLVDLHFAGIDTLNLSVGRLRRYALLTPEKVEITPLNLQNEVFTGLKSERDGLLAIGRLVVKLGLRHWNDRQTATAGPGATTLPATGAGSPAGRPAASLP